MDLTSKKIAQQEMCRKYGSAYVPAPAHSKVGITLNVKTRIWPINGLRHSLEGDTSGWFIWAGEEMSQKEDFFQPLHIEHLDAWCPEVIKYLGLAPGWRFLIAPGHEDVWEDKSLLGID